MKKTVNFQTDDPYRPENIPLYKLIYDKNLISLGGLSSIDNMFLGLNIRGLQALDVGFGLGGVAIYLAEKYQMQISGIEIHPWMAEYAKTQVPKHLISQLAFTVYDENGKLPYPAQSFDLVYSKGVLNHVNNKGPLFCEINKILKPGGLFVIADWIYSVIPKDKNGPLVYETKISYEKILTDSGFTDIEFRDDSQKFAAYTAALLKNLTKHRKSIEKNYGTVLFSILWQQHIELLELIKLKQKIATRIVAKSTERLLYD